MANESKNIKVDLPVCEVTLMEDRARVIRRGKVELPAGVSTIVAKGISLLAADKTLQGRLVGAADDSSIVSSKVQREHRQIQDLGDTDVGALARKFRDVQSDYYRMVELYDHYEADRSLLNELEGRALREMLIDSSWGRHDRQTWASDLTALRNQIDSLTTKRKDLGEDKRQAQEEMNKLNQELAAAGATTNEFIGSIEAAVDAKTEGTFALEFEYVVPAACWRPCHTATLTQSPEGAKVEIEAEACVWQCTGEAWRDVQLYFSTQRPSLGIEPPALDEDELSTRKKPDKIVVETREQTIQNAGMGQGKETTDMPGIDDGGEALNLKGAALATVPSDGQPYRVVMFTVNSDADASLVCMPELAESVILQSEQANSAKTPLLAGPVDLIRDHGKVGRTEMTFIAAGEKFKLGWGPDIEVRVSRWQVDDKPKSKMLSSWEAELKKVHVRLSNLGGRTKSIKLSERIPISEIEQVEIDYDKEDCTQNKTPDKNGIIDWDVSIGPNNRTSVDFNYTIRKKKSVEGI